MTIRRQGRRLGCHRTYLGLTDTATLTVSAGPADHIILSPDNTTLVAGTTQTYTAQTADEFDNLIADVTASTVFSTDIGAGGTSACQRLHLVQRRYLDCYCR